MNQHHPCLSLITEKKHILLRADANAAIGMGHVMRLLALETYLREQFSCVFVINRPPEAIKHFVLSKLPNSLVLDCVDKAEELLTLREYFKQDQILVVDGYYFDEAYQKSVKPLVSKLVVIDDVASIHFYADMVINHGGESILKEYRVEPYTRLLLGLEYVLLRDEFLDRAPQSKRIEMIDSIFVCFGGADPFNFTLKTLQAIQEVDFIRKIIVIAGSAYQHHDALSGFIKHTSKQVELVESADASTIVELFDKTHISICPSSTIALEACCAKTGLITGWYVNNQTAIHQSIVSKKCAISIGNFNECTPDRLKYFVETMGDPDLINEIMENQRKAIDGKSKERIVMEVKKMIA